MQVVEVTGKSVEEAKKAAAKKLGVAEEQLEVSVLEEVKGLFGKTNVRVRAAVVELAVEAPKAAPAAKEKAAPKAAAVEAPAAAEEKPAAKRGRGRTKKVETEEAPVEAPAKAAAPAEAPQSEVVATQADADQLHALLVELVAGAGLQVVTQITNISGRYVTLEMDGKDVAYLIGKNGEVLNTLQYLLNIIAGKKFNNGVRATLDGGNYRARREQALTKLATRIADQVKERGEEAVLDALPAFERRLVHKALSEIDGIMTYSEGEEPARRVVIAPAE